MRPVSPGGLRTCRPCNISGEATTAALAWGKQDRRQQACWHHGGSVGKGKKRSEPAGHKTFEQPQSPWMAVVSRGRGVKRLQVSAAMFDFGFLLIKLSSGLPTHLCTTHEMVEQTPSWPQGSGDLDSACCLECRCLQLRLRDSPCAWPQDGVNLHCSLVTSCRLFIGTARARGTSNIHSHAFRACTERCADLQETKTAA